MHIEYHKEFSHELQRDMEYKIYGTRGKPILVFPTSYGKFYQYEDFGMINEIADFINDGKIQLWACDSIDTETFHSEHWDIDQRIERHTQFERYIMNELVPSILDTSKKNNAGEEQKIWVTGCSLGGYHAANFFFRHPFQFDGVIAMSGVYSTRIFFGDYMSEKVYFHSPNNYLANLTDDKYLSAYRKGRILITSGQGAYEEDTLIDMHRLEEILRDKAIPAQIDYWGHDVYHDWDWWRKQIRQYMGQWVN